MKKIIRILAVAVCSIIFLFALLFERVKYDTPLSIIESVKYFEPTEKVHAYRPIVLTPTDYKSSISKTEIVAKALYQGDTIGLIEQDFECTMCAITQSFYRLQN